MPDSLPLVKGTLDLLVLKALSWGPLHGFEITTWLEARSDGGLAVEDGALYQALHRMEARGLVAGAWGVTENNRRARYYTLSADGKRHLRTESTAMVRYANTLVAILAARSA